MVLAKEESLVDALIIAIQNKSVRFVGTLKTLVGDWLAADILSCFGPISVKMHRPSNFH